MKIKNNITIFFLLSLVVFLTTNCKQPKYSVEFVSFESDTISANPIIKWEINPKPTEKIISILKIAKINEGETIESALKKESVEIKVVNSTTYQYFNKPYLENNGHYAIGVTVLKESIMPPTEKDLTTADGKIVSFLECPFSTHIDKINNDTEYIIDFQPNYSPFIGDTVDWNIVKVEQCPEYMVDPYVDDDGNIVNPGNSCIWDDETTRRNAVINAITNPGNQYPDPILVQTGLYIINSNGPCVIPFSIQPPSSHDNHAFIIQFTSRRTNYSRTFYFYNI